MDNTAIRNWTKQLYNEYESVLYKYKIKDLKNPIIAVVNSKTFWGEWDSNLRTIKISETLIIEYPWDIVINILKHEIAHQIVSELFKQKEAHGEFYQLACDKIGVPIEFRSASGDLPRIIKDIKDYKISDDNQKLLNKVDKLLHLAESKNEHESNLAMKKAQQLIQQHNLERINHNTESNYVYKILHFNKKRLEIYQRHICNILNDYFFVRIIYTSLYNSQDNIQYKTIEILGSIENVLMAEYVYFFLENQLNYLWKEYKTKNKLAQKLKTSYWLGLLNGFESTLAQIEEDQKYKNKTMSSASDTISALICKEDAKLNTFINQRFPRLVSVTGSNSNINSDIYNDGNNDGKNIKLRRAVTTQNGTQIFQLM